MNGAGNDFIIIDARKNNISFSPAQISSLSSRRNIGCDQFIVIKNSDNADCFMEIYNSDGSQSKACGNATRCVAKIIMEEKLSDEIEVETLAGILNCKKSHDEISVEMAIPKFGEDFYFNDLKFYTINVGNPHAVCFIDNPLSDEDFFFISKKVQNDEFFPEQTNVEFARIASNNIIEVRVFERGAGETLACGTGACAVGAVAIKNKLVSGNKIITRFKGGDLRIDWSGDDSKIIMTGGYKKVFSGIIDKNFL